MIRAELQAIYWPRASFSGSRHSALSLASLSAFTACQRRNRFSTLGAHQRQHRNADKQITTTQINLRFPGPMFRGFRLVMGLIFLVRAPSMEIARCFTSHSFRYVVQIEPSQCTLSSPGGPERPLALSSVRLTFSPHTFSFVKAGGHFA